MLEMWFTDSMWIFHSREIFYSLSFQMVSWEKKTKFKKLGIWEVWLSTGEELGSIQLLFLIIQCPVKVLTFNMLAIFGVVLSDNNSTIDSRLIFLVRYLKHTQLAVCFLNIPVTIWGITENCITFVVVCAYLKVLFYFITLVCCHCIR